MIIGIVKETKENENRVAITPDVIVKIKKLGFEIQVEKNAGIGSNFSDQDYMDVGAKVCSSSREVWDSSDIIAKINAPTLLNEDETLLLSKNKTLISFFGAAQNKDRLEKLSRDNIFTFKFL